MLPLAMFALTSALAATANSFAAPTVPTAAATPIAMSPATSAMRTTTSSNNKKQPQPNATPWPGYLTPGQEAELNERFLQATFNIDRSP